MEDPVITVDGHTFDRTSIEEWFSKGKKTNPMTGTPLKSEMLIPNILLKRMIT